MDMITDRKKANEMTNDYIKFQKQHGLKMEPKVEIQSGKPSQRKNQRREKSTTEK